MKTVKLADHGHFKAKEILPVVIDSAQGVTVAQMLRNGVLTVGQAVAIAAQTCAGLSASSASPPSSDAKPILLLSHFLAD